MHALHFQQVFPEAITADIKSFLFFTIRSYASVVAKPSSTVAHQHQRTHCGIFFLIKQDGKTAEDLARSEHHEHISSLLGKLKKVILFICV